MVSTSRPPGHHQALRAGSSDAARIFGAAAAARTRAGVRGLRVPELSTALPASVRADLGERSYSEIYGEGEQMDEDAIIDELLAAASASR